MLWCTETDGVLGYMENYRWQWLPGRLEAIQRLYRQPGNRIAITTDQPGVGHGLESEAQVLGRLVNILEPLDIPGFSLEPVQAGPGVIVFGSGPEQVRVFTRKMSDHYDAHLTRQHGPPPRLSIHVCFGSDLSTRPEYRTPGELGRHKPAPGMLYEAMSVHGVQLSQTCFIGISEQDFNAARNAHMTFHDATRFHWERQQS